jgi:putative DNA primase/helicase
VIMDRDKSGGPTPEVMQLKGARLASINETQENQKLSERRVKYIVSNEPITARNLHEGLVTFVPTHKPWLRTNYLPVITGTDLGIWRRIGAIRFPVNIAAEIGEENIDRNFVEKFLLPELPGILNWALAGLRAYLQQGLDPPAAIKNDTAAYRHSMDFVARWLSDCCTTGVGWTYTADAYDAFTHWYRTEISDKWVINKNRFGRIIYGKFGNRDDDKENGQRVYRGFALRPEVAADLKQRRAAREVSLNTTPVLRGERPQRFPIQGGSASGKKLQ